MDKETIEKTLISNNFTLDTYFGTNKKYVRSVNEDQFLYVRIYSDMNTIQEVEYEHVASDRFEKEGVITLESIDSLEKLKMLVSAIF